jgi:hypothetical protein
MNRLVTTRSFISHALHEKQTVRPGSTFSFIYITEGGTQHEDGIRG